MPARSRRPLTATALATRIVAGALLGLIVGTMAGGAFGFAVAIGLASLTQTGCIDGDCASLAVFALMPMGASVGGAAGAIGSGRRMARISREEAAAGA